MQLTQPQKELSSTVLAIEDLLELTKMMRGR